MSESMHVIDEVAVHEVLLVERSVDAWLRRRLHLVPRL